MKRTHHCNQLHRNDVGKTVRLIGWVQSVRDHGGLGFVDLRDREGITQVVIDPQHGALGKLLHSLKDESVIEVMGSVSARPAETINEGIPTGEIEVIANEVVVHNIADTLPFPLDDKADRVSEDIRFAHRYLDLRRGKNINNLRTRHRISKAIRNYLDANDFVEIETPCLFKATPEGAREFLVPSRVNPGLFYALSQSPQQYKQMLMVSGVEKYYSLARCFRDEDLRADRQQEFTQVDLEMSFIECEDIYNLIEGMMKAVFSEAMDLNIETPFERMPFVDAMNNYGCDKPDTRFDLRLKDLSKLFEMSEFKVFSSCVQAGGSVKAINAKGLADISQGEMKALEDAAKSLGAKGLAFIKVEHGEWKSPILKFLSKNEIDGLASILNIEDGDMIFFAANDWTKCCNILGRIRLDVAKLLINRKKLHISKDRFNFLWIVDFPLISYDEDSGRYVATHHPFTAPIDDDIALLKTDPQKVRGQHYDMVLNGFEIGGGSLRIHDPNLQEMIMKDVLALPEDVIHERFGYMLRAFRFGAPPHGGIALGLDRLSAIICGTDSIRDVIAFPKTQKGQDLMAQSPSTVSDKQLRELHISLTE
ncbi:MAG: aspartate--tRNA ligase [Puniceicoccales bacterium]|nr:aspartate--tRNA ligase [Puniceicoccales bacterium]